MRSLPVCSILVFLAVRSFAAIESPEAVWSQGVRLQNMAAANILPAGLPHPPADQLVNVVRWNQARFRRMGFDFQGMDSFLFDLGTRLGSFSGKDEDRQQIEYLFGELSRMSSARTPDLQSAVRSMEELDGGIHPPVGAELKAALREQDISLRAFEAAVVSFQRKAQDLRDKAYRTEKLGLRALQLAEDFSWNARGLGSYVDRAKSISDGLLAR